MLLVVGELEGPGPGVALRRAHALSRVVDDALYVLHVLSRASAPISPDEDLARFAAERDLRRICRAELPEALGADLLSIRHGDLVSEAVAAVARIGAGLVVLTVGPTSASLAAELAARAAVPVLVARPARSTGAIVAATSLEHAGYPVVRLAAMLRARLETPVALLHNVEPAGLGSAEVRHHRVEHQTRHLSEVSAALLPGAELLTFELGSAALAILAAAARTDCDVVVVGVPHSSGGSIDFSVAEEVARSATASVLVAPLE